MYYTAISDRDEYERGLRITIALAVSTDGGHTFSPHEAGAVVAPDRDNPIETYVTSKPTVQLRDGVFRMWYSSAGPTYRVRYAESKDGIVFRSDPRVIVPTSESGWDSEMTEYAMELELPGAACSTTAATSFQASAPPNASASPISSSSSTGPRRERIEVRVTQPVHPE